MSSQPSADEVHEFDVVSAADVRLAPCGAWSDLAVLFERDAICAQTQRFYECCDRWLITEIVETSFNAIELDGKNY